MSARNLSRGALAALALLAARPAEASVGRLAELQVSATSLRDLLNARFRESPACPSTFNCPGGTCILDHTEFPNSGTFVINGTDQKAVTTDITTAVPRAFFLQPVKAFVTTEACATTAGCAPSIVNTTVAMRLFVQNKPGDATRKQLCADPESASPALPGFDPGALPTVCDDLDFGGLQALVGDAYALFGAELAVAGNASRIGIRLEMGDPVMLTNPGGTLGDAITAVRTARRTEWNTFFSGTLGTSQAGSQWSALFSNSLLEGSLARRIGAALSGREEITVTRPAAGQWWPFLGTDGAVSIDLAAEASVPVCPDVGIDPISFYLPFEVDAATRTLHIEGNVDWDTNDWDVFVCGALGSFLGPSGLMVGEIVANAFAAGLTPGDFGELSVPPECEYDGEHDIDCDFTLNLPIISTGPGSSFTTLNMAGATPTAEGLVVFGTTSLTSMAPINGFSTSQVNITYGIHGGCNSMHVGYEGSFSLSGGARICSSQKVDSKAVYQVGTIAANSTANQVIPVEFPAFGSQFCPAATPNCAQTPYQQFIATPYPLKVTVRTTAGIKTISLPAPTMPTAAQEQATALDLVNRKANCMARSTGLFGIPGMYDPRWDIDPPPVDLQSNRLVGGISRAVAPVTLSGVSVELVSASTDLAGRLGRTAPQVLYRATATLTVDRVTYRIPVSLQAGTAFGLTRGANLSNTLRSLSRFQGRVDLSRSLPAALSGTGFNLDLPVGALRILGTTR